MGVGDLSCFVSNQLAFTEFPCTYKQNPQEGNFSALVRERSSLNTIFCIYSMSNNAGLLYPFGQECNDTEVKSFCTLRLIRGASLPFVGTVYRSYSVSIGTVYHSSPLSVSTVHCRRLVSIGTVYHSHF